jgi:hypothetical protein
MLIFHTVTDDDDSNLGHDKIDNPRRCRSAMLCKSTLLNHFVVEGAGHR